MDVYERQIQHFDEAIRANPLNDEAYNNRGVAYYHLGQYEQAIQDYDEVIRLNPQDADAYNNRAFAYGAMEQPEQAIRDFDMALRIDPSNAQTYYNRGLAYLQMDQYEQAIQDFDNLARLAPKFAVGYNLKGLAYFRLGNLGRALHNYEEAIRLDPEFASAYYNKGLAYYNLGPIHQELAIQDYEEAVRLDPKFGGSYYNMGPLYGAILVEAAAVEELNSSNGVVSGFQNQSFFNAYPKYKEKFEQLPESAQLFFKVLEKSELPVGNLIIAFNAVYEARQEELENGADPENDDWVYGLVEAVTEQQGEGSFASDIGIGEQHANKIRVGLEQVVDATGIKIFEYSISPLDLYTS